MVLYNPFRMLLAIISSNKKAIIRNLWLINQKFVYDISMSNIQKYHSRRKLIKLILTFFKLLTKTKLFQIIY